MEDILNSFGGTQIFNLWQILLAITMSFVLTSVFAVVYKVTFQGLSYSRSFVHTMVLGGMVVCVLIMAIGNNLARGLGILGTLAIIRFRTPIRDPRDMIFLFMSFGIGIACGAHVFLVAVVGTICISTAALVLHWSPFASRREYEGLLRFALPLEPEAENELKDTLRSCCSTFHLIAMRESAQGDAIEYSYQVRLLDPSYQAELVDKLHTIDEVTEINLLMQRTTVEL